MRIREEWVTVELASRLRDEGWRIISVHPPGGQGPFVIPRDAIDRVIERSSFHPDLVAIRQSEGKSRVLVAETKPSRSALERDIEKLRQLTLSRAALLFILFRCQRFPGGPKDGVDFEHYQEDPSQDLPIEFVVACAGEGRQSTRSDALLPYCLTEETYSASVLTQKYSQPAQQ